MQAHRVVVSLLLICLTPLPAGGADAGFYLGFEGGQSRSEMGPREDVLTRGTLIDSSADETDETFGVYGGYAFTEHVGIELAYADLGEASYTEVREFTDFPFPPFPPPPFPERTERQLTTAEGESLSLSLLGRYQVAAGLFLLGRAGLAIHRLESNIRIWIDDEPILFGADDKASAGMGVLGLGVEWNLHPRWSLRLQAQHHFALEDEPVNLAERGDVSLFTAGIGYRL